MSIDLSVIVFVYPIGLYQVGSSDVSKSRDLYRKSVSSLSHTNDGKLVGYLGESTIITFADPLSAVEAALSLIRSLTNNAGLAVKVGICTGDLKEEGGFYGEALTNVIGLAHHAPAPGLLIDEEIFEAHKQTILRIKPAGELPLKHLKRPIEVYKVDTGLPEVEVKVQKGLTVLPFANLSADLDLEFFSDGISREIANALGGLPDLRVISFDSSLALKKRNLDMVAVGKLYEVAHVVTGSVRRAGNQLRIGVSFLSTADGKELWSANFEGRNNDIFKLMEQILASLANLTLQNTLRPENFPKPNVFATESIRSFDFYLKGSAYLAQHAPDEALKAISFFERSFDEDIHNDRALAGMATGSSLVASFGLRNPSEYFESAIRYAREALELNANNLEAHIVLSYVAFYYRWDWEQGLMELNRALRIRETTPQAHIAKAVYFLVKGIFKEARKELNQALEVDPGSLTIKRLIADSFYHEGDYAKALRLYDDLIKQNPEFQRAAEYKGWALMMKGDLVEAIELFKTLDNEMTLAIKSYTQLGYAYAQKGDRERALKYLEQVQRSEKRNKLVPHQLDLAILHVGLGDHEVAIRYLEACVEEKMGAMVFLKVNPVWAPLRTNPNFKALLKRVGLA